MKNKLPEKLSTVLALAMRDLYRVERSKGFVVNMYDWVGTKEDDEPCAVCLAGSVMVTTLKIKPPTEGFGIAPGYAVRHGMITEHDAKRLRALNDLRTGAVDAAFQELHGRWEHSALNRPVYSYESSPKRFRTQMKKLIKDLKKAGL